ncbi:MAG: hypothetical protein KIG29_05630 [Oscillospiraceae bacterium]|nr:hypothetical protein [Oscillospiraceae bacterium]
MREDIPGRLRQFAFFFLFFALHSFSHPFLDNLPNPIRLFFFRLFQKSTSPFDCADRADSFFCRIRKISAEIPADRRVISNDMAPRNASKACAANGAVLPLLFAENKKIADANF